MSDVAVADAIDAYLERKAVGDPDGPGAGAYAANAESILHRWAAWLDAEHDLTSLFSLEPAHLRAYAAELGERVDRGEYTASTARTYFAVVRAFLSWCVRGGILEMNPARAEAVGEPLPPAEEPPTPETRERPREEWRALEAHLRERALEAGDDRSERLGRLREYAMVALLAHTGVRGSELFRVPEDDRRGGATWEDVDFYRGTVRVLGKSGRLEDVPLPAPARKPLRRYRIVLDPPRTDWPLFPTRHAPSIARCVRTALDERGHDEAAIERLLEAHTASSLARDRAIAPPAITTEGARSILKRLCADAEIDVDGDYLTPREGRREQAYRQDAQTAGTALRVSLEERAIVLADEPGETDESPARRNGE